MGMVRVETAPRRNLHTCLRCGYQWLSKLEGKPVQCPNRKCQSPYWDRPRRKEKAQ